MKRMTDQDEPRVEFTENPDGSLEAFTVGDDQPARFDITIRLRGIVPDSVLFTRLSADVLEQYASDLCTERDGIGHDDRGSLIYKHRGHDVKLDFLAKIKPVDRKDE